MTEEEGTQPVRPRRATGRRRTSPAAPGPLEAAAGAAPELEAAALGEPPVPAAHDRSTVGDEAAPPPLPVDPAPHELPDHVADGAAPSSFLPPMASEEELSATTNAGTAIDAQLPDPALAAPARTRGRRGGRGRGRRGAATMDQPEEAPLVAAEAPREEQVPPMGNEESTGLVVPREQAVAEGEARVAAADAPAEPPLSGEGEAPEGSPAAPRAVRRGRSRTPSSPVKVNVGIPRGLGRRISARLIEQVVQLALEREGWQTPALLDIHLIDDDEMRAVNAARRGIDEVTDVLSFPLLDLLPGKGLQHDFFVLPPDEPAHLGEVVISYPRVEAQAEEAGHSRERELAFLTVHGVLHVLGYDHDTDERRRQMRRREEDVLSELGLRRTPSG